MIAGGESGSYARPTHPNWIRMLRDQCARYGVPFHFKQWGHWSPEAQGETAAKIIELSDEAGRLETLMASQEGKRPCSRPAHLRSVS